MVGHKAPPLKELTDGETEYLDETLRAHHYLVRAYDEQGNRGEWSQPTRLQVSETSTPQPSARTLLWAAIGVFDQGNAPHIETLAPPMSPYRGKGGQEVIWNELPLDEYEEEAGEIDWEKFFTVSQDSEAYAVTYLDSPKPQAVKFEVHQRGGSKVRLWLNGMYLKHAPDSAEFIGKLRPGHNKLLMHLSSDQGTWRSTFRVLSEDGQMLRELTSVSPFDMPFQPLVTVKEPRPWAPEQATGPPDMPREGGGGKAYGPAQPQEGLAWVYLTYDIPMHARQVRIFEVYAPGFVAKVELYDEENKSPHTVWEGFDPTKKSPAVFEVVFPQTEYRVIGVKITLDTQRGWGYNDIDAVQLVGAEGEQWATGAVASSFGAAGKYTQTQVGVLSMPEVVEHLRFDGAPEIRQQSSYWLRYQLRDAAIPFLQDALFDPDASVRISAIQELAELNNRMKPDDRRFTEAAVDILLDHLKNRAEVLSEAELRAIFDGLCHLGHSKAIFLLLVWAKQAKLPTECAAARYVVVSLCEKGGSRKSADRIIREGALKVLEAENYARATGPFEIYEALGTWQRKYLCVPDTLDHSGDEVGEALYQFDVPEEGNYTVWGRVMASH